MATRMRFVSLMTMVVGLLLLASCSAPERDAPAPRKTVEPIKLTDANFDSEVLKSKEPVLVDFWAPWCGPCLAIAPAVEELASDYEGKIKVAKLNVDEATKTSERYDVEKIPTLILFKNGAAHKRVTGIEGPDFRAWLTRWVKQALEE